MGVAADRTATHPRPGGPTGADAALPEWVVMRFQGYLSAAAGCVDAVCLTRLDDLFASVITGNLVQLGRAIATVDRRPA